MQALLHGCACYSMSITTISGKARTVRVSHALNSTVTLLLSAKKEQMNPSPTRRP